MSLIQGELIIAVDFDGTITTEPDMGKPLVLQAECKRVLTKLADDGIQLILWTCRTGKALSEALRFLDENDMANIWVAINDQHPAVLAKYYPDVARKAGADFYIDDKVLGFEVDWLEIEHTLYGCIEEEEDVNASA